MAFITFIVILLCTYTTSNDKVSESTKTGTLVGSVAIMIIGILLGILFG